MSTSTRRLTSLLAAATLPLTVGLAACGSDDPAPSSGSASGTITVLAAASLTDTFALIEKDYEKDHPGVDVQISYAASSTIVQQVNGGAPADVIALAGMGSLEPLTDQYRVGEVAKFTTNSLQLAVPPDNPGKISTLKDIADPGLKVVVCAEQVPCGSAAKTLFEQDDLHPAIASYEQDVRATLSKVELGEADVGLVYRTDVTAAGDRVKGIDIPADENVVNTYPILAVSKAPGAQQFVDEVMSQRGQAHLTDAGFVAP